jgi:hypothetical protein
MTHETKSLTHKTAKLPCEMDREFARMAAMFYLRDMISVGRALRKPF